jgi:hemerythrin-like metal-binding protein
MTALEWDPKMAVGHDMVDSQHKGLIAMINDLSTADVASLPRSEISRMIRRFYDYTVEHFRTEESLMDHATYPYYFTQVSEHLSCSAQALEFHRKLLAGDSFDFSVFLEFIVHWFKEHTLGIDQTLTCHLRERGLI